MLNFKQYLKETTFEHWPSVNVTLKSSFPIHKDFFIAIRKAFTKHIEEEYHIEKKNYLIDVSHSTYVQVILKSIPENLFNKTDFLGDFHEVFHSCFQQNDDDDVENLLNDAYANIEVEWPIAYPIKSSGEEVLLRLPPGSLSLKDVEKKIIGKHPFPVTVEADTPFGILSLLKIKNLDWLTIRVTNDSKNKQLLSDIISKHVTTSQGDMIDIISCQEELMDAGLGDYAKL